MKQNSAQQIKEWLFHVFEVIDYHVMLSLNKVTKGNYKCFSNPQVLYSTLNALKKLYPWPFTLLNHLVPWPWHLIVINFCF